MFRMLRDIFGGGIFGLFFALLIMMMVLVVIIAGIAAVVIFPVFFLALIIGSAFSSVFLEKATRRVGLELGNEPCFSTDIGLFMDSFSFGSEDLEETIQNTSAKERQATDNLMKVQRGLQSLRETYNTLMSEHTVKKHFYSRPKITSERIKNAAMTTFDEPSFTKTIADIENERVRFEEFLI